MNLFRLLNSLMEKEMNILTWLKDKWTTFWEGIQKDKGNFTGNREYHNTLIHTMLEFIFLNNNIISIIASLLDLAQNTHKTLIIAVAHVLTHQQAVDGMIIAMAQQQTN